MQYGQFAFGFLLLSFMSLPAELRFAGQTVIIDDVRRQTLASIRLTIGNSTASDVFVPYCGDLNGDHYLCDLAVGMEVFSGRQWKNAQTNCDCGVLGGIPLAKGIAVAPGKVEPFVYRFAVDNFKVKRGQRVRLRLYAWPNETFLPSGQGRLVVYSAPFSFP